MAHLRTRLQILMLENSHSDYMHNAYILQLGLMNLLVTEEDWEDLFYYINDKNTTPFLGAGVAREHFGSGSELEEIAKEFEYPFDDTWNLAKVAQFADNENTFRVRKFVADYIKNKKLPDFNNPAEPHKILAKLDLPIYITTN